MEKKCAELKKIGIDAREIVKTAYDGDIDRYMNELNEFLTGYDFLRLGMDVSQEKWNLALIKATYINKKSSELGLTDFSRIISNVRYSIASKNINGAKQEMSLLVNKRVRMIEEIKKIIAQ